MAVAALIQETNTFSPAATTLADFQAHGLWLGAPAADLSHGTNTEIAGAVETLTEAGAEPVPIVRAWAMSGGTLDADAFETLRALLIDGLRAAAPLDGLVLCLHGALAAAHEPAADAALTEAARSVLGPGTPLIVTHDLHANVTPRIVAAATALVGFRTYPHIDQADTGRRGANLLLRALRDRRSAPHTVLAKRPLLLPAESQALADPPMARLRRLADAATTGDILDVSLFPVQPWLDVPELGFGVTVTTTGDRDTATRLADELAQAAWTDRPAFDVALHDLTTTVSGLKRRDGPGTGPVLLVQSADSPTAGATADSAAVIGALLDHGQELTSLATVVDPPAVAACFAAGPGGAVRTTLGATLDSRWSDPVPVRGHVVRLGTSPVVLTGDSMTGQRISMGRWAVLATGRGPVILVTERPAPTFDPAAYRHAGLEPRDADAVVVRSATMYRAGFHGQYATAYVLDLPGASTPRFAYLDYHHAPRPLHPLDPAAPPPTALFVEDNRVPVYYAGGTRITEFRTGDDSAGVGDEDGGPEDWVGSVTALPTGLLPPGASPDTGVSMTAKGSLRDLITADPTGWLGDRLARAFDGHTGLLVKLLDAGERLPVHCHPTREFARAHLHSPFGKTEGWIVLRADPDARVWLGMRERVAPADLRHWITEGDLPSMLAAMNELPVHPGQVIHVPAGLPHAIGPGVTVIELQEPTSFSVLADHHAFGLDEDTATLGLGWDTALSCFDLSAHGTRLDALLPPPRPVPGTAPGGRLTILFPPGADPYFRAWLAECDGEFTLPATGFAVLVVTAGTGILSWPDGPELPVRRGSTLVVPAAAGPMTVRGALTVVVCLPPEV